MDLLLAFEPVSRLLAEGFAVKAVQIKPGLWFYLVRSGERSLGVASEEGIEAYAFKGIKGSNLLQRTSYVLVYSDGKVLLLKRDIGKIIWEMPGGGNLSHESPVEAAKRELFEETSLRVGSLDYIGSYFWFEKNKYLHFYLATDFEGEVKISKEHLGFAWFEVSKLPDNLALSFRQMTDVVKGTNFAYRNEETCRKVAQMLEL